MWPKSFGGHGDGEPKVVVMGQRPMRAAWGQGPMHTGFGQSRVATVPWEPIYFSSIGFYQLSHMIYGLLTAIIATADEKLIASFYQQPCVLPHESNLWSHRCQQHPFDISRPEFLLVIYSVKVPNRAFILTP